MKRLLPLMMSILVATVVGCSGWFGGGDKPTPTQTPTASRSWTVAPTPEPTTAAQSTPEPTTAAQATPIPHHHRRHRVRRHHKATVTPTATPTPAKGV